MCSKCTEVSTESPGRQALYTEPNKVTYPNRTPKQCQQCTQVLTSMVEPPTTAQITVPETRAIGIFYVEKPLMPRTFGADLRNDKDNVTRRLFKHLKLESKEEPNLQRRLLYQ